MRMKVEVCEYVMTNIFRAMKVAAKKKYSARFNHDGSEKGPGEYEALTPIEEKFCARVRV